MKSPSREFRRVTHHAVALLALVACGAIDLRPATAAAADTGAAARPNIILIMADDK